MLARRTTDAIIVGAGPAGLEAALVLARAGRSVVVLDGGPGRNAPAAHSYNVFTRDGTSPDELRHIGRAQARHYGARFVDAEAVTATSEATGVRIELADGSELTAKRLLLATGVTDVLPDLSGVAQAWGATVVHCPYCHGHELRGRATAVLGTGERGAHLAELLLGWTTNVTLCTGVPGLPEDLSEDAQQKLGALGVVVDARPVAALDVTGRAVRSVAFEGGERLHATAVYVQPPQRARGPLPDALALARTATGHIEVDETYRTSTPYVWACGDMITPMQAVQMAAASGFAAAAFLNHDLVQRGTRYAPTLSLLPTSS
ncbi:MAG: NAD(P)/FAD-dependent oxidoreductase [Bacteroidota bacterium]